jgi:hypothetical protein
MGMDMGMGMGMDIIISGSACSTVGVHSQAWSTSGISRLDSVWI